MATVRRLTCLRLRRGMQAPTNNTGTATRDTGFARPASLWVRSRGETEAEIRDLYGIEGKNFATKEHAT
jgi:hypothetical protein